MADPTGSFVKLIDKIMATGTSAADIRNLAISSPLATTDWDEKEAYYAVAKVVTAIYDLVRTIPGLKLATSVGDLGNAAVKIGADLQNQGSISPATLALAASAVTGVLGAAGFGAAAAFPVAAPVALTLGILGTSAGIILGVVATHLGVEDKEREWDIISAAAGGIEAMNRFAEFRWSASDDKIVSELKVEQPVAFSMVTMLHYLSPSLSASEAVRILDGSFIGPRLQEATATLNAIRSLVTQETAATPADFTDALQATWKYLTDNNLLNTYAIRRWAAEDQQALYQLAREHDDVRAALVLGTPFYIRGLQGVPVAAETLTLFDPATQEGALTEEWLRDRIGYLSHLAMARENEAALNPNGAYSVHGLSTEAMNTRYVDEQTGIKVDAFAKRSTPTTLPTRLVMFGSAEVDVLLGQQENDRFYGGDGSDIIKGAGGDDYIEGQLGGDDIYGEAGNDKLLGGAGRDNYYFAGDFGRDVIVDSDSTGNIVVDGRQLTGAGELLLQAADSQPNTVWTEKNGSSTVAMYSWNTETNVLTITAGKGTITVQNYSSGALGISAPPAPEPPEPPEPQTTFDFSTKEERDAYALADTLHSTLDLELRNVNTSWEVPEEPYILWKLRSTTNVRTGSGDDLIEGGAIAPGSVMVIRSGAGEDRIFARTETTLEEAIARGDSTEPLEDAHHGFAQILDGGSGADLLVGSDVPDVLFGGEDGDTIVGGRGNDIIIADGTAGAMFQGPLSNEILHTHLVDGGGNDAWQGLVQTLRVEHAGVKLGVDASDTTGQRTAIEVQVSSFLNPLANTSFEALEQFQDTDVRGQGYVAGDVALTTDQPYGQKTNYAGDVPALRTNVGRGDDLIYAGQGDDVVNAGAGDDIVFGGDGADFVAGYEGMDYIEGGDGADRLFGDYGVIPATDQPEEETIEMFGKVLVTRNTLDASWHGRDIIDAGAGDDAVFGGGMSDDLWGGDGDDWILGDDIGLRTNGGDDYIDGEDGNDKLVGGVGADQIEGGRGDDLLVGDVLEDDGQAGLNDYLNGDEGNDHLWGGAGNDRLFGGSGNDILRGDATTSEFNEDLTPYFEWNATLPISAAAGNDYLDGEEGSDYVFGDGGDDWLRGGADADYLQGGTGNDTLEGGEGADLLYGGAGNDTYVFGPGDGSPNGIDTVQDTEGTNTLRFTLGAGESLAVAQVWDSPADLAFRFEQKRDANGAVVQESWVRVYGALRGQGAQQIEIDGQVQSMAAFLGANLAEQWNDWSYDDGARMYGGALGDSFYAYGSDSEINGGRGDDYIYVGGDRGTITLARGDGNDLVEGSWLGSEYANSTLVFAEDIERAQVKLGRGETGSIVLAVEGGDASVTVDGGIGFLRFQSSGEQVSLQEFIDAALLAQVTDGDDFVEGTKLGDSLRGGPGDDVLVGHEGDDQLLADGGSDVLFGGQGDDTYTILAGANARISNGLSVNDGSWAAGADRVVLPGAADTATWSAAIEDRSLVLTVDPGNGEPVARVRLESYFDGGLNAEVWSQASIEFQGGGSISRQQIMELVNVATEGDDALLGTYLEDILSGLGGNDLLQGFGGNDSLSGGTGADNLDGGEGEDILLGGDGDDTLAGGWDADALQGGAGLDLLAGGDGSDLLEGGADADLLYGGLGNDTLDGGSGDDVLSGDAGDDILRGAEGSDFLQGGAGRDRLEGGAGDDTYLVPTAGEEAGTAAQMDLIADAEGSDVLRLESVDFASLRRALVGSGEWELSWATGAVRIQGGQDALSRMSVEVDGTRHALQDVEEVLIPQVPTEPEGNSAFLLRKEALARYQISVAGRNSTLAWRYKEGESLGEQLKPVSSDAASLDLSASSYREDNTPYSYTYTDSYYRDAEGNRYTSPVYTVQDITLVMHVREIADKYGVYQYLEFYNVPTTRTGIRTGLERVTETVTVEQPYVTYHFQPAAASVDAALGDSSNEFTFNAGLARGGAGDDVLRANMDSFTRNRYLTEYGYGWYDQTLLGQWVTALGVRNQTLLTGATTATWMDGGVGNDHLIGSEVSDTLYGGSGVNLLEGGTGPDRYLVLAEEGDNGYDVIRDVGRTEPLENPGYRWYGGDPLEILPPGADIDTVEFGPGIRFEQLTATVTPLGANGEATLTLSAGGHKLAEVAVTAEQLDGTATDDRGIEFFEFQDGQRHSMAEILALAQGVPAGNHAPVVQQALVSPEAAHNQPYSWVLPAGAFTDADGDALAWTFTPADAASAWLQFDPATRTLSGTPGAPYSTATGTITATDPSGATASQQVTVYVGDAPGITLAGTEGADVLVGTAGADTLDGGAGNDNMNGGAGRDRLLGGEGNDALNGGAGADTMVGGTGNDTYYVDDAADAVVETDGEGTDTVWTKASLTADAGVENIYSWSATANLAIVGNALHNVMTGGTGADSLDGGAGNDNISGDAGSDSLLGGEGNDALNGGAGADSMVGGTGNDTYYVDDTADTVVEVDGEGVDTVWTKVSFTADAGVDNIYSWSATADLAITGNALNNVMTGGTGSDMLDGGAGNDNMNGDAGSDHLLGGEGNDALNGGAGADLMVGGTGNDTYYVDDAADTVVEADGEGVDTVWTKASFTADVGIDNIYSWSATADLTIVGNALNNVMTAGSGSDTLDGGAGNDNMNGDAGSDTLLGGEGNDALNGGSGADLMVGGTGNDTYYVDDVADTVVEADGEGVDVVWTKASFTAGAGVENIYSWSATADLTIVGNALNNVMTGGTGSDTLDAGAGNDNMNGDAGSDTLLGGEGNDALNGGTGADVMIGGLGNDTYYVDDAGDTVVEADGEGVDTVWVKASFTADAGVDNIYSWSATADMTLVGNALNNVMSGGTGADTLDGGAGNDNINGGAGNDTYRFGRGYGADLVSDNDATAGNNDTVQLAGDIASDQLWLRRVGNNLELSIIGTADRMTISGWYDGQARHVETIRAGDGKVLTDGQVQALVDAMAAFAPPAAGETQLSAQLASQLAPTLAATWQ